MIDDREIISRAPDRIQLENVGSDYQALDAPTPESASFYAAARERWPLALDEIERLRGELARVKAERDQAIEHQERDQAIEHQEHDDAR